MDLTSVLRGYWLDRTDELGANTVDQYRYLFNMFSTFVGEDTPFDKITARDIKQFLAHLTHERGLSKRTAAHAHTALASLWTWACAELGAEHLLRQVKAPKFQEKPIELYSQDQIKAMLKACEATSFVRYGKQSPLTRHTAARDKAIIFTLLDTGIRASELCNLTIGDYEESRGRLYIRQGKGSKDRIVYAGRRTQKALWRYLSTRKNAKPDEPLFSAGEFCNHIERNNLRKVLQRIGERAGVKGVFVHRFRHTFAVNFLRAGGNLAQLRLILGHEDVRTVLIYAKLAEIDLEQAALDHSPADAWRL